MPIPLPNLDDRRWADLVEEGRSLIPLYAPEWTDHNASDPGITLMELFAWVAEMDIYQGNRVPDRHKRKFLELVGIAPDPPLAARAVVGLQLKSGAPALDLPEGVEFFGDDDGGTPTPFRALHAISVAGAKLQAVQSFDGERFQDLTGRVQRGQSLSLMGAAPIVGAQLYLGFDQPLPAGSWTSLYFLTASPAHLDTPHHSARTRWEYRTATGWHPPAVEDATRSLTQSGAVRLKIASPMASSVEGDVAASLYWVRVSLVAGEYDAPPEALFIVMNAVGAAQSVPAVASWNLATGVTPGGTLPQPGEATGVHLKFDSDGRVSELSFDPNEKNARFVVLQIQPQLVLEAVRAGAGTGGPNQALTLRQAPVEQATLQVFSLEDDVWHAWHLKQDLDDSGPGDLDFLLDPTAGTITFGDGAHGRVPPAGALIFASYRVTRAEAGNVGAGKVNRLADSPHNRVAIGDPPAIMLNLERISNPAPAAGGTVAETLTHASGRAIVLREAPLRAVSVEDIETLAKATPGVQLARVGVWAGLYPGFDCFPAAGVVTVILVPAMPVSRPYPSLGLRRAVLEYLSPRRIIGTRIEVTGPQYLEVAVQAQVTAHPGASKTMVRQAVVDALNAFLDPLIGGPDRTGWPFGRNVYRSEVLQAIAQVAGVDRVESLALFADGCGPLCGNVCLRPVWLVTPGPHQIEVL
jgi:hypothetical protein